MPFELAPCLSGGYVILNDIDFDGAEWNICSDFVDKIRGQRKSETFNKV